MANAKRSGLGRGLSSLLGESRGEFGQTYQKTEEPPASPVEEPVAEEEPHRPEPRMEISEEAASNAEVVERPASARSHQQPHATPASTSVSASTIAKPPVPYIEEDDHVTIKEVVSREKKVDDEVDIELISPNPDQPRTNFNKDEIDELARSIERDGLLQPILVRKVGDRYQIIAGERRWQACKSLGLERIPIRIREVEDDRAIELALIENIQRSDLNPIEEAYGYKRLMERNGFTQSEVAQVVSKGRSTIANALRLLDLPEEAQQMLYEEKITAGHARAILSVPTPEGRDKLTQKLREEKLSVRETEALARLFAGQSMRGTTETKREPTPLYFKKAARALRTRLNTSVRIKTVKGKNKIEIEFKDEEELQRIFAAMSDGE